MISRVGEMLVRFWRRPALFKCCFFVAWLFLGISRFLILALEFRRIASFLGYQDGIEPSIPIVEPKKEERAKVLGAAIQTAARFTPWESNCFPQAVTATIMLRCLKIPYAMYFGVRKNQESNAIAAHAWVVSGRARVTGGASFRDHKIVGCFVSKECQTKRLAD